MTTTTAMVIGGGIAGPVAAMALRRAGVEAVVYEAYSGTADGVGGGLSIAPNGLDALEVIGAREAVERIGTPIEGMVMQSWTGKRLGEFGSPAHLPAMQFVWRDELYRALYDEAVRQGITVEHGKRLVDATDTGDGVRVSFADGTTARADILIGADGIRSTVRGLLDPAAPRPRYAGLLGFGARTSSSGLPGTGGRMHMVFGKRAFFGYQIEDDSSGGWFANLPRREPMTRAEAVSAGADEWLRVLRDAFADDRTPATRLIELTDPAGLVITGALEDIPTVPVWSRGRMVLIGDAAHPTSPSSGQGASLAIESAVELARCLRDLPHDQAFAAYERARRSRVERIIALAARTNSDKAAGPVARVLRDLLMPTAMRLAKPEKFTWQFEHHIEWTSPAAVPA
ncbi:FAD-dependent oxidoreductase [Amycolatopsis thermophila]|uniref:2-polyprenyl-6-methoxyphenol hydroxylase-like FAD-dependent oxidoreductase n=1 Tax=Amycolatopsis thermophila TaxID=206084 RepID=A0ABU0ENX7_9PSEU|nr:NAD(P)/FAD-dependent oxidoreductase [Amycolatopsis thermophila]MDQ0376999.1 2-polyprenyl-6-methoxyphenol hydroxylase-like FAD-dependent oxidoreductase [Amycolatopsis thermophila]